MPEWLPPAIARSDPRRATYALTRLFLLVFGRGSASETDQAGRTIYNVPSPEQNSGEAYGLGFLIMSLAVGAAISSIYSVIGWKALFFLPIAPFVIAVIFNVILTLFAALAWPVRKVLEIDELRFNSAQYQLLFLVLAVIFLKRDSPLRWIGSTWLILLALNGFAFVLIKVLTKWRRAVPDNA